MNELTIVPSSNTWESHFGRIGVTPMQLADGLYRGTWIVQYAEDLAQLGIRATLLVAGRNPGMWEGNVLRVRVIRSAWLYRLFPENIWRWKLRPLGSLLSSVGLKSALQESKLIYLQEYSFGRSVYFVLQRISERTIAAYHGTSISQAPKAVRRLVGRFRALTALTSDEMQRVRQYAPVEKVHYVPNWVNEAWSEPLPDLDRPIHSLLVLSRLEERTKSLSTLLEAVRILSQRQFKVSVTVVGTGPDEDLMRQRWEADPLVSSCIRFLGRINDRSEIIRVCEQNALLVNTSRVEGQPISVIEAASRGCGLVLSDLPYVADLGSSPSLHVFEVGSAEGLADSIQAALCAKIDHALQSEWANEHFGVEAGRRRLLDLLNALEEDTV